MYFSVSHSLLYNKDLYSVVKVKYILHSVVKAVYITSKYYEVCMSDIYIICNTTCHAYITFYPL